MQNDLLRRVPFLMHRVVSVMVAGATKSDGAGELNIHAWRVMIALLNNPGMSVGDLSELTRIDQTNMSHLLRRMLRQGMLTKRRSAADNRVVEVRLTPEGLRLASEFSERTLGHEAMLLKGFSESEEEMLRSFLHRLYANAISAKLD